MIIRQATEADILPVYHLHQTVARQSGGIARIPSEITETYVQKLFTEVNQNGLMLVGMESGEIVAEIHATKYGIHIFNHILTNLTIVVHPARQGQGLGKQLFQSFLNEVMHHHPEIGRIELESRASNQQSINLYRSLDFALEGTMKNKTRNPDGTFEDSVLMAWTNPTFSFK